MMSRFDQYRTVEEAVGWADRGSRVRLRVSGPDAAKFLQNVTTNDVKRLPIGRGREAFVTSLKGRTLAFVTILALPDSILVRSDPGGLSDALPHFQKYGVFDDVEIVDRSLESSEHHLVGPGAEAWLVAAGATLPEADDLAIVATQVLERDVLCVRESPTGRPGFTLIDFGEDHAALGEALGKAAADSKLVRLDDDVFEALRIEAGTPVVGREVLEANLPQEINRDDRAISFVKGCYIGQETVARLDALGHVNRIIKGLLFQPGDPSPPAGASLEADGKNVGAITSAAFSPGWNACVGMALVRVSHAEAGTELSWRDPETGEPRVAVVADPPMFPPRD